VALNEQAKYLFVSIMDKDQAFLARIASAEFAVAGRDWQLSQLQQSVSSVGFLQNGISLLGRPEAATAL